MGDAGPRGVDPCGLLAGQDGAAAAKQPPTYRALRFVLPGDVTPLPVDGDFNGGCELTVSPFGAKEQ